MRSLVWYYSLFCALLSIFIVAHAQTSTNDCFQHASAIFSNKLEDAATLCGQWNKTLQCIGDSYLKELFWLSPTEIAAQLCQEHITHWFLTRGSCIRPHGFRLLACLASAFSRTTPDSEKDDSPLLHCKRMVTALRCPEAVLRDSCGGQSVEELQDTMDLLLSTKRRASCEGFSLRVVDTLRAEPAFGSKHNKLSACMDEDQATVTFCLEKFVNDKSHLSLKQYFCNPFNKVQTCLKDTLQTNCPISSEAAEFFTAVLTSFGAFQCETSYENFSHPSSLQEEVSHSPERKTTTFVEEDNSDTTHFPLADEDISNLSRATLMERQGKDSHLLDLSSAVPVHESVTKSDNVRNIDSESPEHVSSSGRTAVVYVVNFVLIGICFAFT